MSIQSLLNFPYNHPNLYRMGKYSLIGIGLYETYQSYPNLSLISLSFLTYLGKKIYDCYSAYGQRIAPQRVALIPKPPLAPPLTKDVPAVDPTEKAMEILDQRSLQQISPDEIDLICLSFGINREDFQNLWTNFPLHPEVRKEQFFDMILQQKLEKEKQPVEAKVHVNNNNNNVEHSLVNSQKEEELTDPISQEPIDEEHLIYLGKQPFDDRQLFLAILSTPTTANPMTNERLSADELSPICKKFGLDPKDFLLLWQEAEQHVLESLQEKFSYLPGQAAQDAFANYLENTENDYQIRNDKTEYRINKAIEMISENHPELAVSLFEARHS